MFHKISKLFLCLLLAASLPLAGCKKDAEITTGASPDALLTGEQGQPVSDQPDSQAAASIHAEFTKADLTDTYDTLTATITCSDSTAAIDGEGAKQNGSVLEITAGGTYLLSGDFNGQILINAPKTEKVQIVLSGFSVTYAEGSPILCEQADKLIVTLAEDTSNTVTDQGSGYIDGEEDENEDSNTRTAGAIHAKCALTINGSGSLSVTSTYHNGIHTKKTLKLVDGNVTVEAPDDGFKGKNAVAIRGGTLTVTSGEDGIQCSEEENTSLGYIWIEGGTVNITAEGDGIDASLYLIQKGGTVAISAIGTERKTGTSSSGGGMTRPDMPGMGGMSASSNGYETNSDGYYKIETKGVKAGSDITLSGGTLTINSTGHAVQSSGTVTVSGDTVLRIKAYCETYKANSKGITADSDVLIAGGDITIESCYEGVESSEGVIYVTDGSVRVENAVDDGFNASGGVSMMGGGFMGRSSSNTALKSSSDSEPTTGIVFSGGYTYVNAAGDGLDSNSNIYISGGTVLVAGPTNNGNGALDSGDNQNYIQVTGGILVAYGSMGMAETPDASVTTQYTMAFSANLSAGDLLAVTDRDGKPVIALEVAKTAQHVVISCPAFEKNGEYTILSGGSVEGTLTDGLCTAPISCSDGSSIGTLTLSSMVVGSIGGMSPGGMSPGGMNPGGMPPDGMGGGRPGR